VYSTTPGADQNNSLTSVLKGKFYNISESTQVASLSFNVSTSGVGSSPLAQPMPAALPMMAAVPEPESYALALAGLGVAAVLMRRRRAA